MRRMQPQTFFRDGGAKESRCRTPAWWIAAAWLMLAAAAIPGAAQSPFIHPGITQNRADLDFMRQKVLAGEEPWKGAWERLRAANHSSLEFQPKPLDIQHAIDGVAEGNRLLDNAR